jgi:hypothetical protein
MSSSDYEDDHDSANHLSEAIQSASNVDTSPTADTETPDLPSGIREQLAPGAAFNSRDEFFKTVTLVSEHLVRLSCLSLCLTVFRSASCLFLPTSCLLRSLCIALAP